MSLRQTTPVLQALGSEETGSREADKTEEGLPLHPRDYTEVPTGEGTDRPPPTVLPSSRSPGLEVLEGGGTRQGHRR